MPVLTPAENVDPGPSVQGICGSGSSLPSGRVFHAYRQFGDNTGGMRVALDGCAFGTHAAGYVAQLQGVFDSLAYA